MALACPVWGWAQPFAPTQDNPGISRLSPVQVFAVEIPAPVAEAEELSPADPASVRPFDPLEPVEPVSWRYAPRWGSGEVEMAYGLGEPRPTSFRRISPQLQLGAGNWSYRDASNGLGVSVGGVTTTAWGAASRLGGVKIGRGAGTDTLLQQGELGYSSSLGMLDYSDASARSGGFEYGPSAGAGALRMGVSETLTMESQVQAAPGMFNMGMGGLYSAGAWGAVRAAAVQSSYHGREDWRYALSYQTELQGMQLSMRHEMAGAGYVDLSGYRAGPTGNARWRNALTAGLPTGGSGVLQGSYASSASGTVHEHWLGLEHSMPFGSAGARLAVGANRNMTLGEYDMTLRLSLPVDMLTGLGRW